LRLRFAYFVNFAYQSSEKERKRRAGGGGGGEERKSFRVMHDAGHGMIRDIDA